MALMNNSNVTDGKETFVAKVMSSTLISIGSETILINIFVLTILLTNKWMRSNANLIIGSMAVTDLMAGCVTVTAGIVKWTDWIHVDNLLFCQIFHTIDIWCAMASIWHVLFVNGERYVNIVFPLKYKDLVTRFRIKMTLLCIWVFALLSAIAHTFTVGLFSEGCILLGHHKMPGLAFAVFVINEAVPFIGVLYFYGHIVYVVMGKLRFMANSSNVDQAALARSQRKMFVTVTAILAAWIICWLPIMSVFLVVSFVETFHIPLDDSLFVDMIYYVEVTSYGNSLLNPILYFITSADFRKAGIQLFRCQKNSDATVKSDVETTRL